MKPKSFALLLLVVLTVSFAGWLLYDRLDEFFPSLGKDKVQKLATAPDLAQHQADRPKRMPLPPRNPVPPPATEAVSTDAQQVVLPLPTTLEQADAYLRERLPQLIEERELLVLVNLNYFLQKLVLFIDHLPEKSIPRLHLPLTPPAPGFVTLERDDQQVIGKRNAARYTPYVRLVEAIPDAPLLQLYRGLYPLLQQAYREIGGPNAHFNDRFIQVIDDLLATPEPSEPIQVFRHVSRFKFVDGSLETRSAGQKILLRMGVENTRRVKVKLHKLRQGLVRKDW